MRVYVGVTDGAWAGFLRSRPEVTEANFWRPGDTQAFRALQVGEPFLFKSRHPDNRLIGGGFFSGFERLLVSEAWDYFGVANGTSTRQELLGAIRGYRREGDRPLDPRIGCVFLRDITFFDDPEPAPLDFSPNIVQGKSYDADLALADDGHLGRALYRLTEPGVYAFNPTATAPTFTTGVTTRRLGQQSFQVMVLSAYGRRCAVTGERIRPVLQAAHILPVAEGGQHRIDNGLLLRSDVHTLFDRGYLGLDGDYRLQVSQRLRAEFGNGEEFFARAGERVGLPSSRSDLPDLDALAWHRENVFVPE